jgi:hypothetical protein
MNPRLLFLVSVGASVVMYRLTDSRTWSFAMIVACYLPALYEAYGRMTAGRPAAYLDRDGSSDGNT